MEDISDRLAAVRRKIQPSDCLFCLHRHDTVDQALEHMSRIHSFFIPDRDHLTDLPGLLGYLGEKVVIGNICLLCPNGGKEFATLEAVRRHMIDKGHCRIAFDTEADLAELADFYDWGSIEGGDSDWEDAESLEDVSGDTASKPFELSPDGLSLTLPSGRVLGHRSLRVYYAQQFRTSITHPDPNFLKVLSVKQRLADPTLALVPIAGGTGAFGKGMQVVKARNAGEAAWVRKQARSFKDQRAREDHKTRVGFIHNSQKHFRDPLLQ